MTTPLSQVEEEAREQSVDWLRWARSISDKTEHPQYRPPGTDQRSLSEHIADLLHTIGVNSLKKGDTARASRVVRAEIYLRDHADLERRYAVIAQANLLTKMARRAHEARLFTEGKMNLAGEPTASAS
jgi:hypothetical protein